MRFYDVTAGSISVDGHDIRNLSRQDYRKQFGMVLQDAWLFEGTMKENLRFGNLEATDEEIVEAAKAANVDHFIRTLPGGYNMEMNQESSNISLGQKQLLTIARALLANPKILILDEATSSVDTRLELLIQKAMKTLMQGRTSFVIWSLKMVKSSNKGTMNPFLQIKASITICIIVSLQRNKQNNPSVHNWWIFADFNEQ